MFSEPRFIALFFVSMAFQDWEDSHGQQRKRLLQQVLLPHEIVGNFVAIGEAHRMIGSAVPCLNL